ncbi:Phosphatidylinositide phosphatase SAC2 [Leucoagaricus sp. SymC.cos]|nr:Phosphatidylinositide phosphatase SAC2 [Leucoagaricus sp. SymC.cos]
MKRLFARASRPLANPGALSDTPPGHAQTAIPTASVVHTPSLQPKYTVPAVPHPCPHDHLAILVTRDGLLIRPHLPNQGSTDVVESYVRVSWGKPLKLEEVSTHAASGEAFDWNESVVVYGIIGVLELFSSSYLLVISSRSEAGNLLDASYKTYGIKGVVAIPLFEESAKAAIKTMYSRNKALSRPSLVFRSSTIDIGSGDTDQEPEVQIVNTPSPSSPRVQFSSEPQVKLVTPLQGKFETEGLLRPGSPQSTSSSTSTVSSEQITTSPILKTVTSRLSFWNRISKRDTSLAQPSGISTDSQALPQLEILDKLIHEANEKPAEMIDTILATAAPPPTTTEERHSELEDKVIRECIREFTKGDMYFSYTFDLTRSLQHKQEQLTKCHKQHELLAGLGALSSSETGPSSAGPKPGTKVSAIVEPYPTLPLWRRVDKQFWWNEWMSKHFIDAGLHSYILPIMQGYFQTASFIVQSELGEDGEECHVDYTIVSRRSRNRAGLRYQRRGLDEEAHVANFVETETIMRVQREAKENIFSYVQIRGSIPLFWTQTGYGLKPPPVLSTDRTHEQNLDALRRHLKRTVPSYGPHAIVNLAEQHGKEGSIAQAYREYVKELGLQDVQYHEYDFHTETKGMKYENISKLIDAMERVFEGQGTGRRDLSGLLNDGVNSLARMYTSTFSDWFCQAVIDFMLGNRTLSVFSEFLLKLQSSDPRDLIRFSKIRTEAIATSVARVLPEGEGLLSGWTLFSPEELNTKLSLKFEEKVLLLTMKALYIVVSQYIRADSWISRLILNKSHDYTLEKVKLYTRVPLGDIVGITKGAYILSPLEEASRDPEQNAGFVVAWINSNQESRVNSYCVRNDFQRSPIDPPTPTAPSRKSSLTSPLQSQTWSATRKNTANLVQLLTNSSFTSTGTGEKIFCAFKALPLDPTRIRRDSSTSSGPYSEISEEVAGASSCREVVDRIVDSISRACEDIGVGQAGLVTTEDVVSLAEAQKTTTMYAKMEYGVKRLLWLGG